MEFELKSVWEEEGSETIKLPEELPATIGEKAEQKLDATLHGKQNGKQKRAEVEISSKKFSEVKMYIAKAMLKKFTEKDHDLDKISSDSISEIAGYYFDQINFFGEKKGS